MNDSSSLTGWARRSWELALDGARLLGQAALCVAAGMILLLLLNFPYDTDRPVSPPEAARARTFYAAAYDKEKSTTVSPQEEKYSRMALEAAERCHVKQQVADIVSKFGLQDKRALAARV